MGLISSVQTLLHYSSLHQVCSYSYPGFKEFPPIHAVLNIFVSVVHQDGTSNADLLPSLKQPSPIPQSRKYAHRRTHHQLLPPKDLSPQKISGTWREWSPLLHCCLVSPLHYITSSSSCLVFALAKKRKEKAKHHIMLVSGGQLGKSSRAGSTNSNTSDALLHLPETPDPGYS